MNGATFRFDLERVRELREHDEDRAKEHLASSLSLQLRGAAMLRTATERLRSAQDQGRDLGRVTAQDLQAQQQFLERTEREREYATTQLQQADVDVASKRDELVEASRRREALERLKERRREEHRVASARAESSLLDEVALLAHARAGATR